MRWRNYPNKKKINIWLRGIDLNKHFKDQHDHDDHHDDGSEDGQGLAGWTRLYLVWGSIMKDIQCSSELSIYVLVDFSILKKIYFISQQTSHMVLVTND